MKNKRIYWIDALRGVAALMVATMHMWETMVKNYHFLLIAKWGRMFNIVIEQGINFGKIGVVAFFLISGYVIPFSLRKKTIKEFVVSRFFRLYPAYWFSILLFLLFTAHIHLSILLANITMFQKFFMIPDLVGVYWTLQIELSFYIICCLLKYYNKLFDVDFIIKFIYALLSLSFLMSLVRFITFKQLPVAMPLGLALMFIGMLWKNVYDENCGLKLLYKNLFIFIFIFLPICFLAYNRDYGVFHEKWYQYFFSYFIGILMFYYFSKLNNKKGIAGYIGNISYSLYLVHPITGLLLTNLLYDKYHFAYYIYMLIFFTSSIVTATFSYYLIESPAIKISRKLFKP